MKVLFPSVIHGCVQTFDEHAYPEIHFPTQRKRADSTHTCKIFVDTQYMYIHKESSMRCPQGVQCIFTQDSCHAQRAHICIYIYIYTYIHGTLRSAQRQNVYEQALKQIY